MFRMILDIEDIDYNSLIDMVSEFIKQNKDNPAMSKMKIPGMGFGFLKNLPDAKKGEMFAMVVNQDKARTIQTLESAIGSRLGSVKLVDAGLKSEGANLQATIDVGAFEFERGIELLFPRWVLPEDYEEITDGEIVAAESVEAFTCEVKALPTDKKELAFLRTIRTKKQGILQELENILKQKNISVRLTELKLLVRA